MVKTDVEKEIYLREELRKFVQDVNMAKDQIRNSENELEDARMLADNTPTDVVSVQSMKLKLSRSRHRKSPDTRPKR